MKGKINVHFQSVHRYGSTYKVYQMQYTKSVGRFGINCRCENGRAVLGKSVGFLMHSICHASTTPRRLGEKENKTGLPWSIGSIGDHCSSGTTATTYRYISRLTHIGSLLATRTTSRPGICRVSGWAVAIQISNADDSTKLRRIECGPRPLVD